MLLFWAPVCSVTNHPDTQWLKTALVLFHSFVSSSGSPGVGWLGRPAGTFKMWHILWPAVGAGCPLGVQVRLLTGVRVPMWPVQVAALPEGASADQCSENEEVPAFSPLPGQAQPYCC